jgi:hypothetical protein
MIFNDEYVYLNVNQNQKDFVLNITGSIKFPVQYNKLLIIAPNPIDRMVNYSGSGLPFPNEAIAFENTPNYQIIDKSGNINAQFKYPNSFYSRDGKNKILPSLFIELTNHNGKSFQLQYELGDLNRLRTLINRENRTGPEFYSIKDTILPIANAENVMYEYAKAKAENDIG